MLGDKEFWKTIYKNAPRSVVIYGSGAFFILAGAARILSWSTNIMSLFLMAVLVLFLMFAVVGFVRMLRQRPGTGGDATDRRYQEFGFWVVVIVTLAIVALGLSFISYAVLHPDELVPQSRQAAAPDVQLGDVDSSSVALKLKPYGNPDAKIEVSVFSLNGDLVKKYPLFGANAETFSATGLQPATRYSVHTVAISNGRPSALNDISVATDADRMALTIPDHPNVKAFYSGPLTSQLVPESEKAVVDFDEAGGSWRYSGPVHKGLLDGLGSIDFRYSDGGCDLNARWIGDKFVGCLSECKVVEFEKGALLRGSQCQITLAGPDLYSGAIVGTKLDSGRHIGPYSFVFEGDGDLLQGEHDRQTGNWSNGALNGAAEALLPNGEEKVGVFENGEIKNGQRYNVPYVPGALSYEVYNGVPKGTSIILQENGFLFGTMSGSDVRGPFNSGYGGEFRDNGFVLTHYEDGKPTGTDHRPYTDTLNADCQQYETFGLDVDMDAMSDNGWVLEPGYVTASPDDNLTLKLPKLDLRIETAKNSHEPAVINFIPTSELTIDDTKMQPGFRAGGGKSPSRSALTLAKMCSAKEITNLANDDQVKTDGLCSAIVLLLARTYYCSQNPDGSLKSDWETHDEKMGNWFTSTWKRGNNPKSLTPYRGDAELTAVSSDLKYQFIWDCWSPSDNIFGLLTPLNITAGDGSEFKFSANGKEVAYSLPMPKPGWFVPSSDQRQTIMQMLKSADKLTVSFQSPAIGQTVSVDFAPHGAKEAFEAVAPTCH